MGFLSRFEGKMEDTLEGAAGKMFDAPISPVQIAKKAEKQMRREKMVGAGKQYAPTLYTVLVNPDDDERLFGYYPTLAGETETYLAAKAADEGLVMDGQPLVRFIVDEDLKHGKFDVIAEPVAAPIIAQLRAEEMARYGLGGPAASPAAYGQPAAAPAPRRGRAAQPQARDPYAAGAAGAADPYAVDPYAAAPIAAGAAGAAGVAGADPYAADPYGQADPYAPAAGAADGSKPPLPYVPEDEIDYSIDYGEYTFDSQDFDDYRQNGPSGAPVGPQGAAPVPQPMPMPNAVAAGAAAGAAGTMAGAAAGAPNTVMFAAGAAGANPVPAQQAVQAHLVDTTANRTYALASARLIVGRESSCDIVLHDINASRTHAELRYEPQGVWTITDLGSTNGTFVNNREVSTAPLHEGDRITIGMSNLVFALS